jgi:alcohol dehydrogenase
VLLDAELTIGLPRLHTAATGIDAMVHAIEAFTSRHLKNPVSDCLAVAALKLLAANLLTACETPADRGAREAMLLGAMLAGQAFTNAPVAAVHALAYPLGGRYHIPHGISNALMLGPVLRFNLAAATREYAELGAAIGITGSDDAEIAGGFIAHLDALSHRSGAPMRLRDVDVLRADLPLMAKDAMEQQRLLRNNPVDVTEVDALHLYEEAY